MSTCFSYLYFSLIVFHHHFPFLPTSYLFLSLSLSPLALFLSFLSSFMIHYQINLKVTLSLLLAFNSSSPSNPRESANRWDLVQAAMIIADNLIAKSKFHSRIMRNLSREWVPGCSHSPQSFKKTRLVNLFELLNPDALMISNLPVKISRDDSF